MNSSLKGSILKTAYVASILVGVILILVYVLQSNYLPLMSPISNISFLLLSLAAVGSAANALKKYWRNLTDKFSQIWLFFTVGLLFWLISKIAWSAYAILPDATAPYPSVADMLWLVGYLPLFAALHAYLRNFGFSLSRIRYSAFALTVSLALLCLYILLVPPVVAASEKEMTVLLGLVYLGLDLSLFSLSVHGLFVFLNGRIGVAWAFVSGALFLNAVGNILFSYATQTNTYFTGHFLELIFHASAIFCTLAFYTHVKEL